MNLEDRVRRGEDFRFPESFDDLLFEYCKEIYQIDDRELFNKIYTLAKMRAGEYSSPRYILPYFHKAAKVIKGG